MATPSEPPKISTDAVLVQSEKLPEGVTEVVQGYDFNKGVDFQKILESYATTGFQATNFYLAVEEINKMLECKNEKVPEEDDERKELENVSNTSLNPVGRKIDNCTIFLSYTSNMVSSGVRETIRYLVQHNMVDVLVTTAGGIEEDFMKCMADHYVGDFHKWPGADLRRTGINRIGNLLVPNENYCKFENWVMPILDELLKEQNADPSVNWTPSKIISRLGKAINNPDSIYYWAYKNNIPVFNPGMTDGALGDVIYFHSFRNPGLKVDIAEDIRLLNLQAVYAKNTAMLILGGGMIKHHTCNANLMRNGANYAVFINTGQEFDGSDSGARPDEAISWGKVRIDARPVKIYADATLIFPLLVACTFAKVKTYVNGK